MPKQAAVYLKDEQFEALIQNQGLDVDWEQAIMCDCLDSVTKQPDYNCPHCRGTGIVWLPSRPIQVIASSLQGSIDIYKNLGFVHPGTIYVTSSANHLLGWRDKLTFKTLSCKFSEVLTYSNNISSRAYKQIKSVIAVIHRGKYYLANVVKKITDDRRHIEIDVNKLKLEQGDKIGILYVTYPSYVVSNMMHELRASKTQPKGLLPTDTELPKQAMCKRIDFEYNIIEPTKRGSELDKCEGVCDAEDEKQPAPIPPKLDTNLLGDD